MDKKKIIQILISVFLIIFILLNADINQLLHFLIQVNPIWLLFGLILHFSAIFLSAKAWKILIQNNKISYTDSYRACFLGYFTNNFIPGSIGGDIARAYYISQGDKALFKQAGSSAIIERLIGLSISLILAFAGALICLDILGFDYVLFTAILLIGYFLSLITLIFVISNGIVSFEGHKQNFVLTKLQKIYEAFQYVWSCKPSVYSLLCVISLSIGFWFFTILSIYSVCNSFDIQISIIYLLSFVPILALISIFPVSFQGIGLREGGYMLFLTLYGVPAEIALAIGLLRTFFALLSALLGGFVFMSWKKSDKLDLINNSDLTQIKK